MLRPALVTLFLLALVTGLSRSAEPVLRDCLAVAERAERRTCADERLRDLSPAERFAALESVVETEPALVEAQLTDSPDADLGDVLGALRRDLLARSLMAQGRPVEAAEAFASALKLDDGTLRVRWHRPDTAAIEELAVGPGQGRLERAARALVAAGRPAEAKPLLARALELGITDSARETWAAVGGSTVDALDAEATVLEGPLWREPLPDLVVRLFGGEERRLKDAQGNVLLLDFWASWCDPCLRELPFIESLYASRRDRGFEVLAINYHEDPQEAIAFAQATGLTLPVGLADRVIERAFDITAMPTVILADRGGRIRGRWAGYEDNVERQLTDLVDTLLDEPGPTQVELGRVLHGAGTFEASWVRVARREIEGLTIVRTEGGPRIAVVHARSLTLFDAEGHEDLVLTRPPVAVRLRTVDVDGDGSDELIGFRPGARTVLLFDLADKTFVNWDAPQPLFDVAALTLGGAPGPELLLGTLAGLWRADLAGTTVRPVGEYGAVSGIRSVEGDGLRLAMLESGARLHWLDRELESRRQAPVRPDAWTLLTDPGAAVAGVASADVTAAAVGHLLPGDGRQVAIGTRSGALVIADQVTGTPRFRAALEGPVTDLAAGDLDGDGRDELVVAHGNNVAVLRAAR